VIILYPEIYDLRGNRLAILNDAYDIHIELELNTWPVLYFNLPAGSEKWKYIQNEMLVKYKGEDYVIKQDEVQEDNSGTRVNTLECPSIASTLETKLVQILGSRVGPPDFSPEIFHESGTPAYILGKILQGTGWSVGTISASLQTKVRSFLSEWETVVYNLLEAAEQYEGYLRYRPGDREIDLLDESDIGNDNEITIEYAKNMTSISRHRDTSELITRLYLFGGGVPAGLGASDPEVPPLQTPVYKRSYLGETYISIEYYPVSGAIGYLIECTNGTFEPVDQPSATFHNLTPGITYGFRCKAVRIGGESQWSEYTYLKPGEPTLQELSAFNNKGPVTALTGERWNDLEVTIHEVGLGVEDPSDTYYRPPTERIYENGEWVSCTAYIDNFQYFLDLGYTMEEIEEDIQEEGEASRFIRVGHLKEDDYIDPYKLFDHGKKKLEEQSKPKTSYKVGLLDLSKLSGWEHESFGLGDWVLVINRDLGIDIKARIVKMTVYPEFPEKTEVELSDVRDTIGDILAKSIQMSGALKRKSGIHNLLRNAISTAATTINSSLGTFKWVDGQLTITEMETDAYGKIILDEGGTPTPTGNIVRLTPGGLGISQDSGQTFDYAITGQGILGERLIVSDAHIVSVEDGYTRLQSSGLMVFDRNDVKRVHVGQYDDGAFGISVHSGSIKITGGGLPNSEIGSVSAGKLIGGTITASEAIYLGNENFELNAPLRKLIVRDPSVEDVDVVVLGQITPGNYGLAIRDPFGNIVVQADKYGVDINVEDGLRIMGQSITWDKDGLLIGGEGAGLSWDGENLTITGNIIMTGGSISWENMDESSREAVKGDPGPPGEPGPPGPPGADGRDGRDGRDGSDAMVPDWVTAWAIDSTYITSGYICTPKMFIGQGGQLANGIKVEEDGLVSYVSGYRNGFSLGSDGTLELYSDGSLVAEFNYEYDDDGLPPNNPSRAWLRSKNGCSLKIESINANMSIGATGGRKVFYSGIHNFGGATVEGLEATAVFG
jgi:phage minor structural protein